MRIRPTRGLRGGSVLLLGITLLGCSAGGRAGVESNRFQREVGIGTELDITEKVPPVLLRYQFEILQQTEAPSIMWLTRWRARQPFLDEQEQGVQAVETRLQIMARPRGAASGLNQLYTVNLTVENRVRMLGSLEWSQTVFTESAEEYAAEVATELKRVLDVGVRRFGCCP